MRLDPFEKDFSYFSKRLENAIHDREILSSSFSNGPRFKWFNV